MRVTGTVQGVGFRPFVYRLARELGLSGWVLNDTHGVLLEVEGEGEAVDRFVARLAADAPPLAQVEGIEPQRIEPTGEAGFEIAASDEGGEVDAPVSPEAATCDQCLAEVFDPADRRHRYPFTNCTNCGPRFTIVRGVPYDRPLTTMAGFQMCDACQAEYDDPLDRRFHAQPNACPDCGPRARLLDRSGEQAGDQGAADAVAAAAAVLQDGAIVAVKGLGGYHFACLATDEDAVSALRRRKHREDKPFALIAAGLEAARTLIEVGPAEEHLLSGRERPIVLAPRLPGAAVAAAVAPASPELGVMLPYSPLHHLLLADVGAPLVLTSGNVSDEPIAYEDSEALERLSRIADLFLVHDRPIETRTDDSVLRVSAGPDPRPMMLRRSRGFVPASLPLPVESGRDLLACGAELKNTFALAKGARAWVGHHIGDLKNFETLTSFREGIEHFERLFDVAPELCAHDLHPDYLSTRYALERDGVELVGVQHHHAHLAACLAEHAVEGLALGAIFDGTGYGTDGTVWGGELLAGDLNGFERAGRLWTVRMPGGEAAIREPWRMACAWLAEASGRAAAAADAARAGGWRRGVGSDARDRLLRARLAADKQRRAALRRGRGALRDQGGGQLRRPGGDRARGERGGGGVGCLPAADGHHRRGPGPRPARGAAAGCRRSRRRRAGGDRRRALSQRGRRSHRGAPAPSWHPRARSTRSFSPAACSRTGCCSTRTSSLLADAGLRVLLPERLPPNDGGISYGQAAVAASAAG